MSSIDSQTPVRYLLSVLLSLSLYRFRHTIYLTDSDSWTPPFPSLLSLIYTLRSISWLHPGSVCLSDRLESGSSLFSACNKVRHQLFVLRCIRCSYPWNHGYGVLGSVVSVFLVISRSLKRNKITTFQFIWWKSFGPTEEPHLANIWLRNKSIYSLLQNFLSFRILFVKWYYPFKL